MTFNTSYPLADSASDQELHESIRLMLRQRRIVWTGIFIGDRPIFAEMGSGALLVPDRDGLVDAHDVEEDASPEWDGDIAGLMFLVDELLNDEYASNIFVDKFDAFRTGFQLGRNTHAWQVDLD